MVEVYNHADKTLYKRVGNFLISDQKILGPRICFENNGSKLFKLVKEYIETGKVKEIEELFGIKIGSTNVEITADGRYTIIDYKNELQPKRTIHLGTKEVEVELFDKYYYFGENSTICIEKHFHPRYFGLWYYENNISAQITPSKYPDEFINLLVDGQLYEKIFKPLGIPPSANITIEEARIADSNKLSTFITAKTPEKEVNTIVYVDPSKKEVRFVGWPFEEGVYSFTVSMGKKVNVFSPSIRDIRKKVAKVSKIFGPPKEYPLKGWKVYYNHLNHTVTYRNNNISIIIGKDNDFFTIVYENTEKIFDKSDFITIVPTIKEKPESIILF